MKVLLVLGQPPHPEGGAPGKTAIALMRGLLEHGVEVRALAARRPFALPVDPPADLSVEVVEVARNERKWQRRIDRVARPGGDLLRTPLAARVREEASWADVIHLEETETAWCDHGIAQPSLVHVHFLMRMDRSYTMPLSKPALYESLFIAETAAAERRAISNHRYLVASSPRVAAAIARRAPRAEITIAPLSLDPAHYVRAPLDGPPTAGIIGTAQWPPTAAAMTSAIERVWPAVLARVPDARLLVAGRGTSELRSAHGHASVDVLGEIPSASEFLTKLSVLLYPVPRGSGMKVKVLEALAAGVPVVTSPSGAEGIEAGDGVVIATTLESFVESAVAILIDKSERLERGRAAREAFDRRYAPGVATRPLVDLYGRMR